VDELPVILVIEDEYAVQGIVEEALTDGGFATDILSSGEEALTLFRSGLKNYKALVADVGLKGRLSGWEVATRIRETDPQFPVIYMSGAHAEDWASKGVPNSIMLAKPFAPAQLVTAVSQLLNAAARQRHQHSVGARPSWTQKRLAILFSFRSYSV
jgi:DNA-binding response OmpR family regulator